MIQHLFRVIFNQSRGLRMVVQETACSDGKGRDGGSRAGTPGGDFALKPLVAASALLLGCAAATAQSVPELSFGP